jgi:hypothetical protein
LRPWGPKTPGSEKSINPPYIYLLPVSEVWRSGEAERGKWQWQSAVGTEGGGKAREGGIEIESEMGIKIGREGG